MQPQSIEFFSHHVFRGSILSEFCGGGTGGIKGLGGTTLGNGSGATGLRRGGMVAGERDVEVEVREVAVVEVADVEVDKGPPSKPLLSAQRIGLSPT